MAAINFRKLWRKVHYWGSIVIVVPLGIVILSGILLQVKKQVPWVQPPTQKGSGDIPQISFEKILEVAQKSNTNINSWEDIDLVDVRPGKGVLKIRGKNKWEIQVDIQTGEILQIAYRRSDLIESIHDGSFFHDYAKLWLFLPAAFILLILWLTGIYLFALPVLAKRKKRKKL